MSFYDLIIVGGGIAGLRVGIKALKINPGINCCILEKYGYIGGRIVTFRKNIPRVGLVQWENGAGRIATTHKKVLHLLKDYGLTFIPIDNESCFINEKTGGIAENNFSDLIQLFLK
jgi:monoamine oxidase